MALQSLRRGVVPLPFTRSTTSHVNPSTERSTVKKSLFNSEAVAQFKTTCFWLFKEAVKNKNSTGSAVFGTDEILIVKVEKLVSHTR